jgi:7-cyano-7-deazaguanine synthase
MCAVIGALVAGNSILAKQILSHIWLKSHERGRDGRGYTLQGLSKNMHQIYDSFGDVKRSDGASLHFNPAVETIQTFIGNLRAEPTTEYVREKVLSDQQPYTDGGWSIVHNGTIANDKDLRTQRLATKVDSAAIAERLTKYDTSFSMNTWEVFQQVARELRGSFAILAVKKGDPRSLFVATNYRPIWCLEVPFCGVFFASARHYFPTGYGVPQMIPPYSMGKFQLNNGNGVVDIHIESFLRPTPNNEALVICSGGLDSVVAATYAQKKLGMNVTLLHFHYGSRAQGPEAGAIGEIARVLNVPVIVQDINVYRQGDSPLLDPNSQIAGGEAGAEFAYEWVPARNLLMLSMAAAIAEARGIQTLILGNNLEEAGAYPDNEPEFIAKFNDLLPFAIGDGKRLQVLMPVGNLMKHEIVALGHEIGAPLHLTWSCYRAGQRHCGTCGPCYMRRTAFAINNLPEVIEYEV